MRGVSVRGGPLSCLFGDGYGSGGDLVAESGRWVSEFKEACPTLGVPGKPGLHRETLSIKKSKSGSFLSVWHEAINL